MPLKTNNSTQLAQPLIDPADPEGSVAALQQTTPTNNVVDAAVKEVAALATAGTIEEHFARTLILTLVYGQRIHEQAVRAYGVPEREREEIIGRVAEVVFQRVMDATSGSGLNLERVSRSSACAWTRKVASNAAKSKTRDSHRAEDRNGLPLDPFDGALQADHPASYDVVDGSELAELDRRMAAFEEFDAVRKGTRGAAARAREGLPALLSMFRCAPAIRPGSYAERAWVHEAIEADERVARDSLRSWLSLVRGSDLNATRCDDRLLSLWDDQTITSAEEVANADPRVAHVLALAAVAPYSRPDKKAIQRLRAAAGALLAGNGEWRRLAFALVVAFVETEFEPVSEYACNASGDREKLRTGAVVIRSRYDELVDRAAAFEPYPLGASRQAVQDSLMALAVEILERAELDEAAHQPAGVP